MTHHEENERCQFLELIRQTLCRSLENTGKNCDCYGELGVDYHRRVCDLLKENEQRRCSKSMEENLDKNINKMWIKILFIEEPLTK